MAAPYFDLNHIHLEITSKCALKCLRCPRTENPDTLWLNKELSLTVIKKNFNAEIVKKIGRITFCGDVGDAIYHSEFIEIIRFFKALKPDLHLYIITNGSYKSPAWWKELGGLLNEYDTVAFSIDGVDQQSNSRYRANSDWESIISGIRTLRDTNPDIFLVWATILFSFNETKISEIEKLARQLKFDYLQITKSTKFGSIYQLYQDGNGIDWLEPSSQSVSKSLRFERSIKNLSGRQIKNAVFLNRMKELTAAARIKYKDNAVFPLCQTSNRGVYVNSVGQVFPCSWTSYPFKKIRSHDLKRELVFQDSYFQQKKELFNINNSSLTEVLENPEWLNHLCSFKTTESSYIECENKCRKELMTTDYEIGWFLN